MMRQISRAGKAGARQPTCPYGGDILVNHREGVVISFLGGRTVMMPSVLGFFVICLPPVTAQLGVRVGVVAALIMIGTWSVSSRMPAYQAPGDGISGQDSTP